MFRIFRNKSLALLFILEFFAMFSTTMTSGGVQTLFALDLGATLSELAFISLFGGFVSTIIQIPFGALSDKLGRKPLLLLTEIITLSSSVMRGFATKPWHLIIASLIGGFSGGAFAPVSIALVGDLSEPSDVADSISMWYLFSSVGMLAGPSTASLLLLLTNKRSLFHLATMIRIIMLLLVMFAVKTRNGKRTESRLNTTSYKENVIKLLRRPNMLVAVDVRLSYTFFDNVLSTYMPILSRQIGLPDPLITSLATFQGLARVGVRTYLGALIRKLKTKKLLILTLCIISSLGFLLPFANSYYYLIVIASLFGLSQGIDSPLSALLVSDASTQAERGFANSLLYSSMSIGRFTPIVVVPLAQLNILYVFPFGAILPILAILVAAKYMKPLSTEQRT